MRHLGGLASIEVRLLPRRVVGLARGRLLIAPPRAAHRLASRQHGTQVAAVRVDVVAPPAQEEHLVTTAAATKRSESTALDRGRQELDLQHQPCDEGLVDAARALA